MAEGVKGHVFEVLIVTRSLVMNEAYDSHRYSEQLSAETSENGERWGMGGTSPEVLRFLQGPQQRSVELWRACRIFIEIMRGFRSLHFAGPCVTVFGSARFKENHPYYALARDAGARLARAGF